MTNINTPLVPAALAAAGLAICYVLLVRTWPEFIDIIRNLPYDIQITFMFLAALFVIMVLMLVYILSLGRIK